MANIIINNKQYDNVPSVTFDKVGGGTATYTEGGGGGTTIEQLNVSSAGTYTAPTGTAYSPVVVPSGSEGTPTATKGAVLSHSVTVTPSVTNTSGFISGGTHTGTGVTVSASELVSGTKSITGAGTTDVTNYANASVPAGSVVLDDVYLDGDNVIMSASVDSSGLVTYSVGYQGYTDATLTSGYVSSYTSGGLEVNASGTLQLPVQPATVITPSGLEQTAVTAGKYTTGAITVKPFVFGALRPDAEKVQTYTYDKLLVQDESITIPAYTTTSTTIKAGAALGTTYTTDYENYNYFILERFVTYPIYSSTSKAKGREEYNITSTLYELTDIPPDNFIASSGEVFTNHSVALTATGNLQRTLYWSSGSAVGVYTSASYGVVQVAVAPTLSSGVITVSSPNVNIRGSGTYLSSTYWGYMTDIRAQYIIDIYRAPKAANAINGWGLTTQMQHILDSMNSNNWTLT